MKPALSFVLAGALIMPAAATADTILGIYAGGQYWNTDNSGSFGSSTQQQSFAFDDEQQTSFYVALEHPIPLIPNIKIRQNSLDVYGDITLTQDFTYGGATFPAGTSVNSMVDLSHTDYTLYYEIFDNDLLSVDLGLTAKRVDGALAVRDATSSGSLSSDGWVPTAYGQVRVGIPATDFTIYGLANAISVDDSEIRDLEAGIEYRLIENLAIDLNLQLGYRDITIELDDLDGVYSDLRFKGPYLGLEVHF